MGLVRLLRELWLMRTEGVENWKARCENVRARACIVSGVLDDGERDFRMRGKQLRVGNGGSKAFKVEGKRHVWDLQDPDLFVRGIKAWMEGREMPGGYVELD